MRFCGLFLFALAAVFLSGCLYYPATYHQIEADQITQPFSEVWVISDPGSLSFIMGDSKRDLRKLRVLDYTFKSDTGPIPITRVACARKNRDRYRTIVTFYYKPGSYIEGRPFTVSLSFDVAGEKLQVKGSFSTHSHTKIEYLPEVLDHG